MKPKTFLQRCVSFLLGIVAIALGMLAAANSSAWHPRVSRQDKAKVFRKKLPLLPEPVKLLEIKTASETIRFPDELLTLTVFTANRDIRVKSDQWSFDSPSEAGLKQGSRALKVKDISTSGPYMTHPYIEVQVADQDDWLKGATFRFRNDSGKTIHHITFELWFPETVSSGSKLIYGIGLGRTRT